MAKYRIFCDKKQAAELPKQVKIEESYDGFCVVSASAKTIKSLRKKYPVEELTSVKKTAAAIPKLKNAGAATATTSRRRYYRVQFRAPVKKIWVTQLEKAGAAVADKQGSSALVLASPSAKVLQAVQEHAATESVEEFRPEIKVGGDFIANLRIGSKRKATKKALDAAAAALANGEVKPPAGRQRAVPGAVIARFLSDADARRAQKALSARGAKSSYTKKSKRLVVDLASARRPIEAFVALAQLPGLKRLEKLALRRLSNDVARNIIGQRVVDSNPVSSRLTGKGEIVAVADSGLDTGDADTVHADFRGRIVDITSYPIDPAWNDFITNPGDDDGAADANTGHGTHVAGSVLGNGARAAALALTESIQGMAPEAHLVFQAVEQQPKWTPEQQLQFLLNGQTPPKFTLFGIPHRVGDLFQAAFAKGARIHNNSWGGGDPGEYDSQCEDLDQFVWDHKDFLVVVAAGNSGADRQPPNGDIDQASVDSPGTAKNCLTVGASENSRGFTDKYGEWWPSDFSKAPFKNDPMADSIDDVVAFSSRGPCASGRRKPDVVAPGTFILSTRSSEIADNNFAWRAFPPAIRDYMFMGGTSMASPLVAGSAALVRQHLRESAGFSKPSAALLKAAIIHSALYMKYRFAHPGSRPFADNEQGWGRVDLASVISPTPPQKVLYVTDTGLQTGGLKEFKVKLTKANAPLRVTMVYTDFPGEDLVNNLNLIVTSPTGDFRCGNDFNRSGTPDSVNNVEGVVVEKADKGTWTIRVVASEVLEGRQDFALVISGAGAAWA
jgi:serine protease AprX